MTYDIDLFVNVHSVKVGTQLSDISQDQFEKSVYFDTVNDTAFPVYVYENKGNPVAWYDEELECGIVV